MFPLSCNKVWPNQLASFSRLRSYSLARIIQVEIELCSICTANILSSTFYSITKFIPLYETYIIVYEIVDSEGELTLNAKLSAEQLRPTRS